ncbi:MAG: NfeD family protein [Vicinamibacterales bacterium]
MTLEWWHWLVVGLVCAAIELATPGGFFMIFFGVAGVVVALLVLAGAAGPAWSQWLLFSAISVMALVFFRAPLLRALQRSTPHRHAMDTLVGETAVVVDALPPGGIGKAELRGTVWTAKNTTAVALAPGQRCRVTRVDGLQIGLAPVESTGVA